MSEQGKVNSWWVRKAVYIVVGVAGLVLTFFGVVSEDQVTAFEASPLLASVAGFLAASFTGRGSDSTATGEDVRAAQASGVTTSELRAQVRAAVHSALGAGDVGGRRSADRYPGEPDSGESSGYPG